MIPIKARWWRWRFRIAVGTILVLMHCPYDWLCLVIAFVVVGADMVFHDPTEEVS